MSADSTQPITFIVPGIPQTGVSRSGGADTPRAVPGDLRRLGRGVVTQSVNVSARRDDTPAVKVTATPGKDVVVLEIEGGPELILAPDRAQELMFAQTGRLISRGVDNDNVTVPARLQWRGLEQTGESRGATRGALGDVILSAFHVVTGLFTDADGMAADLIVDHFDKHVDAGVYALSPDSLPDLTKGAGTKLTHVPAAGDAPLLVLIHGTFSDTYGTFSKLWTDHPQRVRELFAKEHYGDRVYALEHPTLSVSPIGNAIALVETLPDRARLHLVTHSRGGLVAEVLAHVCTNGAGDLQPFTAGTYPTQRAEMQRLAALVAAKGIQVDRVVRVACPARGTLLASKRLDAYLSVFKWTLQLAHVPIAPQLVEFLAAVAQHRTRPDEIPGLEAMTPDSALVVWLNSVENRLPGQLRVVAGDIQGDSVVSWVKTLLADAFYWTDNDLVVQTRSMYGGGPRSSKASFLLDAGGKVSHFNYFANDRTAGAIVDALVNDTPPGFQTIGPLSWAGDDPSGVRGGPAPKPGTLTDKTALFLLPGILGSNLKAGDQRIWLSWRLINGLSRLRYPNATDVAADGPIGLVYDELIAFLSATHDVIPFAFDWRVPIEVEARRLAADVREALTRRANGTKGVQILAHSMGGLLARAMEIEDHALWRDVMTHKEGRLLMLGTPNAGSWAPMQVLSADDTFGNAIVAAGEPFDGLDARMEMAGFPGFLQLQAGLLDDTLGLVRTETWQKLADDDLKAFEQRSWWHKLPIQLKAVQWGVPPQSVLTAAADLRRALDTQRDQRLFEFRDKMLLVTGHARFTPDGFDNSNGFVYLNAPDDGDGRVTRESAMLPGVKTWTLDCDHGSLPSRKQAFDAYRELLTTGDTMQLDPARVPTASRGGTAAPPLRISSRPSRSATGNRPAQNEREALSVRRPPSQWDGPASPGIALPITVVNGDLTFTHWPLLLGHYQSSRLTGTESVMNKRVGTMERALEAGLYPDAAGTNKIFVNTTVDRNNPWQLPRPPAVIVVGLGQEGNLKAGDIVTTVRQGVIAWAHRLVEDAAAADKKAAEPTSSEASEPTATRNAPKRQPPPQFFDLATTLVGSGGTGVTARQAAMLIAQGVREANERLNDERTAQDEDDPQSKKPRRPLERWPQVGHLYVIELYLERAAEALAALKMAATANPGRYAVDETIRTDTGALRRPLDAGYRGADYDFVTALMRDDNETPGYSLIDYTLDTKRARSEVRAQQAQRKLLINLVTGASNELNTDAQIGRTLFKLLIPSEMESYLTGTTDLQLCVDSGTAGIPWELLDTDVQGRRESRPWAIRVKLLRKLRTSTFRERVVDADADASALVIGEPACPQRYPRLFGARAEAKAVAACLSGPGGLKAGRMVPVISPEDPSLPGPDARAIMNALMERPWRIVHIAGHGEPQEMIGPAPEQDGDPPQKPGRPRGVVLSDGSFLGPAEIRSLRQVPELVFVNCCHLAARMPAELLHKDHVRLAAGVATELIAIGVRCVVAAGWAVDDAAAAEFATTFYKALLRGHRFIDAVAQAREAAWTLGGNTWAAYQCYGDPDWVFRPEVGDAQRPTSTADDFAAVTSPTALLVALETLAVTSETQGADPTAQRDKIRFLEDRFGAKWGRIGKIADAFGKAWAEAEDFERAIAWYDRAVAANDSTAGMKASEQRWNLRVRVAAAAVDERQSGTAAAQDPAVIAKQLAIIEEAIEALRRLAAAEPSMERKALCGSAHKRLALVYAAAGNHEAEAKAIAAMLGFYREAEAIGRSRRLDFFYPAMNRLAAELAVHAGDPGWQGLDATLFTDIEHVLQVKVATAPEFWSVEGEIELRVFKALAARDLAGSLAAIRREYEDLHDRLQSPRRWKSVYDTARLILPPYKARVAAQTEKDAADDLLGFLARNADGTAHPAAPA